MGGGPATNFVSQQRKQRWVAFPRTKDTTMLRQHAFHRRLGLAGSLALMCALRAPQAFAQAQAQARAQAQANTPATPADPATVTAAPTSVGSADAPTLETAAKPAEVPAASDLAALRAELDETKKQLDEVKTQQGDAEAAAASPAENSSGGGESLKLYGFMDVGVQRYWANPDSTIAHLFPLNNTSFVVGNLNIYLDAQPTKYFRGLLELRFTNSPFGDIANYGGLAGTFQRKDSFSFDSTGTASNAPIWAATVILERAWIEWNQHQAFKLRVGNFFTPFGIWNEDHGTPTLISLALPQFIIQRWMPIRQTGIMVYGNAFAGDWELGYMGTFSNGRQEISNVNFDNNFGVGARVYARRDTGHVNTTLGLSYFTGKVRTNEVDVVPSQTGINGLGFVDKTVSAYTEHVAGADVSVDIGATRIRAEAIVRRQVYATGQHEAGNMLYSPGAFSPNEWQESAYLLVAHQLPWGGIEPYLWGEAEEEPTIVGDAILIGSVGLNVHFNSSIQWKTQVSRIAFKNWLFTSPYDISKNDVTAAYSRLVMAF
jgi:hypothetical protein